MTVGAIPDYLKQHWPAIREQLLSGTYEPKPVRRVEIPKPDGGGIRTTWYPHRVGSIQRRQVMQVLAKGAGTRRFPDHSYGFRPKRSAHQAVAKAQQYVAEGYGWVEWILIWRNFSIGSITIKLMGSDCQTGRRQAAAETHPGIS